MTLLAEETKKSWKPDHENVSYFSHKMLLIVGMSDFIGVPQLKILDLSNVMKMLRTHIIQNLLPKFNPLILKLGSGA